MILRYTITLILGLTGNGAYSDQETGQQIDQDTWGVISQAVANADIEAMSATYHPDAVVVNGNETVAIRSALSKWAEGMKQAAINGSTASVSFRFASRQDDESTAFETGIFKYSVFDSTGNETLMFMNFETLLVKKENRWLFLMERQLNETDESSWEALQN